MPPPPDTPGSGWLQHRPLPLLHRDGDDDDRREFQLHRLTGEFADPDIEAGFEASRAVQLQRRARNSLAVGMLTVGLPGVSDAMGRHRADLWVHLVARALTILPLVLVTVRVSRPEQARAPRFPFAVMAGAAGWSLAGLIAHLVVIEHADPLDLAAFCTFVLVLHLVVPNRLRHLAPITAVAVVAFAVARLDDFGVGRAEHLAGSGLILLAWAGGAYFHRELEIARREEYIALRLAAGYNERLEAAMTRSRDLELQLRHQVNIDPLTEVGNRRWFFAQFELEFSRSQRSGRPLSVLILDIDHFKAINDTHGHGAGDQVLQHLVTVVRSSLRATDLLARIGGEEFAVLMPETPPGEGHEVGERVRRAVAADPVLVPTGVIRVTTSVGVTACRPTEEEPEAALARADANLYEAKTSGRDLVITR